MQVARVIGTLVATRKHHKLEGAKLLIVQPLDLDFDPPKGGTVDDQARATALDRPRGVPLLTIDSVGAGIGEKVLIVIEGRAAGDALGRKAAPVDAAIIGIIDRVDLIADHD